MPKKQSIQIDPAEDEEKISFAQMAYNAIKEDVASQKLKPGTFISEAEYAEKIGTSRTPVREAFKTLEREGLLDIFPRKGAQIKNFTLEDILHIHKAAEALEGVVMSFVAERHLAGKISEANISTLLILITRMDKSLEEGNLKKWLSNDHLFHNHLISLCDNPYLTQYASASRNRMNLTLWFITPKYADRRQSSIEHRAIVDAIRTGDTIGAGEAARTHIYRIRKKIMDAVGE